MTTTISFKIRANHTKWGECIGIAGNLPELAEWGGSKVVLITKLTTSTFPTWMASLCVPAGTYLEYKYVLMNIDGSIGHWEEFSKEVVPGNNRSIYSPPAGYDITIDDGKFGSLYERSVRCRPPSVLSVSPPLACSGQYQRSARSEKLSSKCNLDGAHTSTKSETGSKIQNPPWFCHAVGSSLDSGILSPKTRSHSPLRSSRSPTSPSRYSKRGHMSFIRHLALPITKTSSLYPACTVASLKSGSERPSASHLRNILVVACGKINNLATCGNKSINFVDEEEEKYALITNKVEPISASSIYTKNENPLNGHFKSAEVSLTQICSLTSSTCCKEEDTIFSSTELFRKDEIDENLQEPSLSTDFVPMEEKYYGLNRLFHWITKMWEGILFLQTAVTEKYFSYGLKK